MFFKKGLWRGLSFLTATLLAVFVGVSVVLEANVSMVDAALNTVSSVMVTEDDGELWTTHVPDEEYVTIDAEGNITGGNLENIRSAHEELGQRIQEEGSVLLKNDTSDGNGLPLGSGKKVTLFGIAAIHQLYVMGRGATMQENQTVYIPEALEEAGFVVNETMLSAYETIGRTPITRPNKSAFNPNEVSPAELEAADPDYKDSFKGQDAAIVVLYRPGAEASDFYTAEQGGVDATSGARSPLGLTTAERDIIKLATDNFDNVIVLLNTGSAMEVDELEENDGISSIMYIGLTGNYGARGIASILKGDANPSGGLADIYAANTMSSPAMQNYGLFQFAYRSEGSRANGTDYLIEAEGIYTGYKYYETRYYDSVLDRFNARSSVGVFDSEGNEWNYEDEVTYSFGYGLSYTDFDMEVTDVRIRTTKDGHSMFADVDVTVKNIGDVAGKTPVQVYVQAPYKEGGVEKAAIQLAAFDKTEIIEKGKSEELTITVDMQNVVSYDETANNGKGTYVLSAGDYYFAVGNGAHDALNNILTVQGYDTGDGMDYAGEAKCVAEWTYEGIDGKDDYETFGTSKAGTEVENQLELANWNNYEGVEEKVTYLSRSDWAGTWPKSYTDLVPSEEMEYYLDGDLHDPSKANDDVSDIKWNEDNGLTLADMINSDFDDPRWEELISQMSIDECISFVSLGGRTFNSAESVGFVGGTNYTENGPFGLYSYIDGSGISEDCPWYIPEQEGDDRFYCAVYPNPVVIASSYNLDLIYEEGELIGNDALFTPRYFLWGPGMNTHRTPYSGRNVEYYSEDPVLTGACGLELAMGLLSKGVIAAPKHLAFNDQDQNRKGIAPFMTEQRARENELRAFQIAFEASKYNEPGSVEIGMRGFMTSFSKLGALEVNIYKELLTNIVRDEWGFNGYVVSDMADDTDLYEEAWIAGMTGYDGRGPSNVDSSLYANDREFQLAIREAAHRNLWVFTQSHYMNSFNTTSHTVQLDTWWRQAYKAGISVAAILTAGFVALYVVSCIVGKKKEA